MAFGHKARLAIMSLDKHRLGWKTTTTTTKGPSSSLDLESDSYMLLSQEQVNDWDLRLSFFVKGVTSDCVDSLGYFFVSQIFWHIAVRTVVVAWSPFLSSSEGMSPLMETLLLSSCTQLIQPLPCQPFVFSFLWGGLVTLDWISVWKEFVVA